jgi:hypothetical protein
MVGLGRDTKIDVLAGSTGTVYVPIFVQYPGRALEP